MGNTCTYKVIFSPQLANYLILHDFQIVGLKRKQGTENEAIFVFLVTPGFYEAIEEWKSHKPKEEE